jgi:hypothetical protein
MSEIATREPEATLRRFGESGFEIVHVDHHLTVVDRMATVFRSSHSILLRAVSRSRFYERVYFWTGTGREGFPKLVTQHDQYGHPLQRILGDVIREGSKRTVVIDLGAPVEPGQFAMIEIEHFFVDVEGSFQRYLAHTDSLSLGVTLPAASAVRFEWFAESSQVAKGSRPVELSTSAGDKATYVVKIEPPERSTRYKIGW